MLRFRHVGAADRVLPTHQGGGHARARWPAQPGHPELGEKPRHAAQMRLARSRQDACTAGTLVVVHQRRAHPLPVALGLAVTLVWLYTEILRLLSYVQRN